MENRPVGRVKRILEGGTGVKRSGEGLGKTVSERNVEREKPERDAHRDHRKEER